MPQRSGYSSAATATQGLAPYLTLFENQNGYVADYKVGTEAIMTIQVPLTAGTLLTTKLKLRSPREKMEKPERGPLAHRMIGGSDGEM